MLLITLTRWAAFSPNPDHFVATLFFSLKYILCNYVSVRGPINFSFIKKAQNFGDFIARWFLKCVKVCWELACLATVVFYPSKVYVPMSLLFIFLLASYNEASFQMWILKKPFTHSALTFVSVVETISLAFWKQSSQFWCGQSQLARMRTVSILIRSFIFFSLLITWSIRLCPTFLWGEQCKHVFFLVSLRALASCDN